MRQTKFHRPVHFSPKVSIAVLLAVLTVGLSGYFLFRSAFDGNLLESITYDNFRFDLCGNGSLSKIVVYKNEKKTATVRTNALGNAGNHYGVTVSDLNFDGYPDLLVTTKSINSDLCASAWVWNYATGTYKSVESMIDIPNPTIDEAYACVISHTNEKRFAGEYKGTSFYEIAEIFRVYKDIEGTIVEYARYELVYYTKNDIYAYQIFRFDEENGEISSHSEDKWIYPENIDGFSLSERMTSDMEAHRGEYGKYETEDSSDSGTVECMTKLGTDDGGVASDSADFLAYK